MGSTADRRYSTMAIVLHWAIALFILFNLITGSFMESLQGGAKHIVVSLHSSSGLTILLLSLARIGLRLTHKPPPLDETLARWEVSAAKAVHFGLYFLMIAMPLIGWSISSASTRKANSVFYFLMPTPKITFLASLADPQKTMVHDQFVLAHKTGAWILLVLLIAHVAGALKHQFLDHRPSLARMWFSNGAEGRAAASAAKLKA